MSYTSNGSNYDDNGILVRPKWKPSAPAKCSSSTYAHRRGISHVRFAQAIAKGGWMGQLNP